jgi:hypothetical protein
MQQNRDPRREAERNASQPMSGQPRADDDEERLEKPENVRSQLTAREFAAPDSGEQQDGDNKAGERHASASFTGNKGEPMVSEDNPPRGKRGQ